MVILLVHNPSDKSRVKVKSTPSGDGPDHRALTGFEDQPSLWGWALPTGTQQPGLSLSKNSLSGKARKCVSVPGKVRSGSQFPERGCVQRDLSEDAKALTTVFDVGVNPSGEYSSLSLTSASAYSRSLRVFNIRKCTRPGGLPSDLHLCSWRPPSNPHRHVPPSTPQPSHCPLTQTPCMAPSPCSGPHPYTMHWPLTHIPRITHTPWTDPSACTAPSPTHIPCTTLASQSSYLTPIYLACAQSTSRHSICTQPLQR